MVCTATILRPFADFDSILRGAHIHKFNLPTIPAQVSLCHYHHWVISLLLCFTNDIQT
jgi:hypothetical protein